MDEYELNWVVDNGVTCSAPNPHPEFYLPDYNYNMHCALVIIKSTIDEWVRKNKATRETKSVTNSIEVDINDDDWTDWGVYQVSYISDDREVEYLASTARKAALKAIKLALSGHTKIVITRVSDDDY